MKIKQLVIDFVILVFPRKLLKIIANYVNEVEYINSYKYKISFSQKGEDIILQEIFNKKQGFYISKEDLKSFFEPHFKNVKVFETIYPSRHNLYFYASDGVLPFDKDWEMLTTKN